VLIAAACFRAESYRGLVSRREAALLITRGIWRRRLFAPCDVPPTQTARHDNRGRDYQANPRALLANDRERVLDIARRDESIIYK